MIKCPNCGQTIPAANTICQFCQKPIPSNLRGPVPKTNYQQDDDSLEAGSGLPPEKVWKIYTFLAWFWIVSAVWEILASLLIYPLVSGTEFEFNIVHAFQLIFGLIQILFGVGMLARWEAIRKFVTALCCIRIVFGLLGLLGNLASILVFGIFGLIVVIMRIFDLGVNAAVIWAINETERLMSLERLNRRR
jgi:membrane-associated HD superfamily phosphohydrolase